MPLRVRCRCGQELVLRFSEWVYPVIGILVLSLIVNACALVLIYLHLAASPKQQSPPRGPDAAAGSTAAEHPPDRKGEEAKAAPAAPPHAVAPEPVHTPAPPRKPEPAPVAAPPDPGTAEAPAAEPLPDPAPARATEGAGFRLLLEDAPPLLRLAIAEAVAAPAAAGLPPRPAEDPRLWGALLHDPDERVRRRALRRLAGWLPEAAGGGAVGFERLEELKAWIAAAAWLREAPEAKVLLDLAASGPPSGSSPGPLPWEMARSRAEVLITAAADLRALGEDLREHGRLGADILLAIDVTESMAEPFQALQAAAPRLFPSILWALPNSRLGLLFYRDDIAGTAGFDSRLEDLLAAIARERAEGGDDPPEGVFEALKGALQLGRFQWRPEARKTIFLIGDAPPAYGERGPLLSLARQCRREAGFIIHAVGLGSWEGWKGVPFFPELAESGGGASVPATPGSLAGELFSLLLPPGSRGLAASCLERPPD